MTHIIDFGKINLSKPWGNPNGKKNCHCEVTLELKTNGTGNTVFTATADVKRNGILILGGNCIDELSKTPELAKNNTFMQIHKLWKEYHLNDLHAGTPKQETALRFAVANDMIPSLSTDYYEEQCEYLKSINLFEVTLSDGTTYRYGHGWLYKPIPDDDLTLIQKLMST